MRLELSRLQPAVLQSFAFIYRGACLTRRYLAWFLVNLVYGVVSSATVVLIGTAQQNEMLTLDLLIGTLMWSFMACLFNEIAHSITHERWEETIEETFGAPVARSLHLLGISVFALARALVQVAVVLTALLCFTEVSLTGANLGGMALVVAVSSLSLLGLGMIVATIPLMGPENGIQATMIIQGLLLLVSGVYYPVSVLPIWLRWSAWLSPATYALSACRTLAGIGQAGSRPGALLGQPLAAAGVELAVLLVLGVLLIPAGLLFFAWAERHVKRTGELKRSG